MSSNNLSKAIASKSRHANTYIKTKGEEGERKPKMKIITTYRCSEMLSQWLTSALFISHWILHGPLGYRPMQD